MNKTLLLIFAALALMIGSFIWFVATWDRDREDPISQMPVTAPFILAQKLPPEGPPALSLIGSGSDPYQTHTGPISNPYGVS